MAALLGVAWLLVLHAHRKFSRLAWEGRCRASAQDGKSRGTGASGFYVNDEDDDEDDGRATPPARGGSRG